MAFKATSAKTTTLLIPQAVLALAIAIGIALEAIAASSLSNSLTSFSGNSTEVTTQNAVAAAGFDFFSITGIDNPDDPTEDPTVNFDGSGAIFGSLWGGDGGRNYMRTIEADYATVSFVAEITFVTTNLGNQDAFIGMGAGDTALFGWPDWSTQFSSVMLTPEITDSGDPLLTTMYTSNDTPIFGNQAAPGLDSGTNRIRMTYNATAKTVDFAMDYNYAGGEFVQDDAAPTQDVSGLFVTPNTFDAADYTVWRDTLGSTTDLRANWTNANSFNVIDTDDYDYWAMHFGELQSGGWPDEPSRIFFGGDDSVIFKDFSVTVTSGVDLGSAIASPEPTSAMILLFGFAGLIAVRKRW